MGYYIVVEAHGGAEYAFIRADENGNNLIFYTVVEAEAEAANCQDGRVVEI